MTPTRSPAARERNRRGEGGRLRDEIVAAAAALVEETGSEDAVTLRAVARRVGIAAPSIYGHFADRDAILSAVLDQAFAELTSAVLAAAETETDPVDRLRVACAGYLAFAQAKPHRYRVLFGRQRTAPAPARTGARSLSEMSGADAFGALINGIEECVRAGRSASKDPALDATALWVALHGYATLLSSAPAFPWPEHETLLDTLVRELARIT